MISYSLWFIGKTGRSINEGFTTSIGGTISDTMIVNTYGSEGVTLDKLIQQQKKVLDQNTFLKEAYEYDSHGRRIITRSNSLLHPTEGPIVDSIILDDANNILTSYHKIGSDSLEVRLRNVYDHIGRFTQTWMQVTTPEKTWLEEFIVWKEYTIKEQIDKLRLGGGLQVLDYTYLKNRYLSAINTSSSSFSSDDLFGMDIGYHQSIASQVTGEEFRHNGDITSIQWRFRNPNGSAGPQKAYRYKYNFLDMLTEAEYFEGGSMTSDYKTTYSYSNHRGNFDVVTRNSPAGLIDDLDYFYKTGTNLLDEISDDGTNQGYTDNGTNYVQDANGFITFDTEGGATITRDHLDHISTIDNSTANILITNSRDATGLLHRRSIDSADFVTTIDRIGMFEFRNGVLSVIHHDNGYVTFNRPVPEELFLHGTVSHTKTEEAISITSKRILNSGADEENIAKKEVKLIAPFEVKTGAEYLVDFQDYPVQGLAYHYVIKDHLGSPRVIFQDKDSSNTIEPATEIENIKDYYPFGLEWEDPPGGVPQYRQSYNNKEAISYTKCLDFGAREYIKTANVFDGPDPISASFPALSTSNYASNGPVTNVDLHGLQSANYMWLQQIEKETGYNFSDNSQAIPFLKKEGKRALRAIGTALLEVSLVAVDAATMGRSRPYTAAVMARRTARMMDKGIDVHKRAREIHETLPIATQRRTTTAVGLADDGTTIVGSSEETLRRVQKGTLEPGEIAAEGIGHAEETVINSAEKMNKTIKEMGSSRPVCLDCEEIMKAKNIEIKSPTSGKRSRTRRYVKNDN